MTATDSSEIRSTLDTLLPAGSTAMVVGAETLTFSNFGYSPTPVAGSVAASAVNVLPFTLGNETGITYTAGWFAAAGQTVDIALTYVVTAPARELINDVYLGLTGGVFGGTGTISVGETLRNATTGAFITSLEAFIPGQLVSTGTFAGVQSILVTKDILLVGGSNGATVSIVDQGFSSTTVPEPTSMALLGIGMASFFTYRRLFKRHSAV
jgi:PEP-CTERM motif